MRVAPILSNAQLQSEYLPKGQTIASTRSAWIFNCNCPGSGADSLTFSRILQWRWCLWWRFSASWPSFNPKLLVHPDSWHVAKAGVWVWSVIRGEGFPVDDYDTSRLAQIKSKSSQRFDLKQILTLSSISARPTSADARETFPESFEAASLLSSTLSEQSPGNITCCSCFTIKHVVIGWKVIVQQLREELNLLYQK